MRCPLLVHNNCSPHSIQLEGQAAVLTLVILLMHRSALGAPSASSPAAPPRTAAPSNVGADAEHLSHRAHLLIGCAASRSRRRSRAAARLAAARCRCASVNAASSAPGHESSAIGSDEVTMLGVPLPMQNVGAPAIVELTSAHEASALGSVRGCSDDTATLGVSLPMQDACVPAIAIAAVLWRKALSAARALCSIA